MTPKSLLFVCLFLTVQAFAQSIYTHQDSLRGSLNPNRTWWDVTHYNIWIAPNMEQKNLVGMVKITFHVLETGNQLQMDLQEPMMLESAIWNDEILKFKREGNTFLISFPEQLPKGSNQNLALTYYGTPKEAKLPPWDGGWVWTKDEKDRPWVSVACQGLGASCWFPCKDHQSDKPDSGATLSINVSDEFHAIGNGKLTEKKSLDNNTTTWTWEVKNPINAYNIIPYIGHYKSWTETYSGEAGILSCQYWVLDYNMKKSKKQFKQVPKMLHHFEHWFGPYPFYEDGYKLVESPYFGMEHQSNIAYGNGFENGYVGTDLSGSGWGMKWDYIIVHESGHEWFGNNITSKDVADMWIHEGFTDYSETLFTEMEFGKKAGNEYVKGLRNKIANDKPIISDYGVNQEGSIDMYYKGSQLVHIIRQEMQNDSLFRAMLREMNQKFKHQTVTSKEIEHFISTFSGIEFKTIFDQYLRRKNPPLLAFRFRKNKWYCKWQKSTPNLQMPVKLNNGEWVMPTEDWKPLINASNPNWKPNVDANFYVLTIIISE